jgi:hypothetical protein
MDLLRRFWAGWKKVGHIIGDFIGRLVLSLLYFTVVLPFGLGLRISADPLALKKTSKASFWIERTTKDVDLKAARRQF